MSTDKKISNLPIAPSINASDVSILIDSGTDYQYTFTSLLQFLAANLTIGAAISFGTVLPQNTTGANGDVFINTSAGSFAQRLSGTWTIVYTLPAANGADGTVLYGAGTPSSSTGKDTDSYINTLTGIFYKKGSGTWSQVFSMATGPQGPQGTAGTNGTNGTNGNTILFGNANPSNSTTGVDGDFYINTANYQFFGPKTSGAWPTGISITGADGAAGAAGAAGAPGTNGQGVVTGGTAGQVLAKIDGTDYNTHWIDEAGGGSTGYTDRTFNPAIVFDAPFKSVYNQTADITLSLSGSPVADVTGRITIVGDGVHALNFPTGWFNANGQTFDNTARNIIFFEYDGAEVLYSIVKVPTPDVTAPFLVSAVISNTAPTQIVLIYSEPLDATSVPATGDFSCNLSKAVTAVAIAGSQVTVTVNSPYVNGDVPTISYTPGGNKIQDTSHNHAVALVNQAVTNNVLPGSTSMSIAGSNQIAMSSVTPANLAFGSGGTDTPISCDFWAKRSNSSNQMVVNMGSASANNGLTVQFVGATLYFQLLAGGGQIWIEGNTDIHTNIWTHIIVTYSGNRLASGMKIYVNGTLYASTVDSASYGGQVTLPSDNRLAVMGTAGGLNAAVNVLVDNLNIWNIELNSTQITELYNGGALIDALTTSQVAHLVASYNFDGNLNDRSTSGYNLTSTVVPTYSTDHV